MTTPADAEATQIVAELTATVPEPAWADLVPAVYDELPTASSPTD